MLRFVSLLALASCALSAHSQIAVLASPFTGAHQEDFSSLPVQIDVPSVSIMGGFATLTSPVSQAGVYNVPSDYSLNAKGSLSSSTGNFGFGNDGSNAPFSFEFSAPVLRFGGYFNATSLNAATNATTPMTFSFFDAGGALIGTDVWVTPDNNLLNWRGYSSTVGISRIEISGTYSVPFDDLQADSVSSVPGPLAALPFALMAIKRRKRA